MVFFAGSCGSGCYAFNTANKIYFAVDPLLATNNVMTNSALTIYPNPAKDVVTIKIGNNIPLKNVQLIDLSGKLIFDGVITDHKMHLTGVAKGTYLVRATDKYGKIHSSKLIKN